MRALLLLAVLLVPTLGYAQAPTCTAQAATKHLAGAAQTSFMNRCKADVEAACTKNAVGKDGRVLAGAAKTSFMTRCMADGVGS